MFKDQYGHEFHVDGGGISLGKDSCITSHFLEERGNLPQAFANRISRIMLGRGETYDFGSLLNTEEYLILEEAIILEREVYSGIKRRSPYYDRLNRTYTKIQREYFTHTEGVVELGANFLDEMNISRENILIALIIGLFHDGIEDAKPEMKEKIAQFLKKHFPKKYNEIIETLFALSHPDMHSFTQENEQIFLPDSSPEKSRIMEGIEMSTALAEAINLDVLTASEYLFQEWKSGRGIVHTLPFRAPKDNGTFSAFISSQLGEKGSPAYRLNEVYGFDVRRIRLLYRYIIHCYHIWWLQHGKSDRIYDVPKFFHRIEADLASLIQVTFYSVKRSNTFDSDGSKTLAEQLTLPIKFTDTVYNAWDNYYLFGEEKDREAKIFKAMMLSFRARYYQELVIQVLGQNSPFHNLMRATTEWLDNQVLTPISGEVLKGDVSSLEQSKVSSPLGTGTPGG